MKTYDVRVNLVPVRPGASVRKFSDLPASQGDTKPPPDQDLVEQLRSFGVTISSEVPTDKALAILAVLQEVPTPDAAAVMRDAKSRASAYAEAKKFNDQAGKALSLREYEMLKATPLGRAALARMSRR